MYRLAVLIVVVVMPVVSVAGYGSVASGVAFAPAVSDSSAVGFKVAGVKVLPNDVSAFVSPVRDLNGDACALVKVVAPADFAFSSPLGIVKRRNEVGEIWLYLPQGSKLLTIKHPRWGVLRNYRFEKPLEGHVVYELEIDIPKPPAVVERDTVVLTRTVTDTVVVSKRKKRRPRLELRAHALFTAAFHPGGPSWGVMVGVFRRHGFYLHAQADLRRVGATVGICDEDGFLLGDGVKPYYTGRVRRSNFAVTAGLAHRLCPWLCLFYGGGYGRSDVAWQLAASEGGGYVLNGGLSRRGVAAEAGVLFSYKRLCVSASALTLAGRQWQAVVGVGIRIL